MKKSIFLSVGVIAVLSLGSCKKDYTCTCTTVIGTGSGTQSHSVDNSTYPDAKNTCDNYETQANNSLPGGTTCHL